MRRGTQRGFTLIEIMIVVAIVAILALVVIPMWTKEARRGKADPEVRAMFSELMVKEESWKSETGNGAYADIPLCPLAPSASGVDITGQTCWNGNWVNLHILPTEKTIRCTYVVTSGPGSSAPTGLPTWITTPTSFSTLAIAWYYILATCDMDNDSTTSNAQFFTASWDNQIQKTNYNQ